MLKMHFYKKMSITWKLYDRFFLYYISADKPQSSLSLKSIVTVELAAQNAGQISLYNATPTYL